MTLLHLSVKSLIQFYRADQYYPRRKLVVVPALMKLLMKKIVENHVTIDCKSNTFLTKECKT